MSSLPTPRCPQATAVTTAELLAQYPLSPERLVVPLHNPVRLHAEELKMLKHAVRERNFVIYSYDEANPAFADGFRAICRQLGLCQSIPNPASDHNDVTPIEATGNENTAVKGYIPFTNKALKWHTDGYYNAPDRIVGSFVLHCRRGAKSGGESRFIDHRLVFELLRAQNPAWAMALSQAAVFSIPAHTQNGRDIRTGFTGPVFETAADGSILAMRYTERRYNISWCNDEIVQDALTALREIIHGDHPWIVRHTLKPGQGVISNNCLHCRSAFEDHPDSAAGRRLERLRFLDPINIQ